NNIKDSVPCVKGVSIIELPPSTIANFVNNYTARKLYDPNLVNETVIENIDGNGNVAIIHLQFKASGFFLRSARRDFCLLKTKKILNDGTYIIAARSIGHIACPIDENYTRSYLYVGGWVIRPVCNNNKCSD